MKQQLSVMVNQGEAAQDLTAALDHAKVESWISPEDWSGDAQRQHR